MNRSRIKQILFSSFLILQGVAALNGETFRVSKLHTVEITQEPSFETTVRLGINESVAIFLPEDKTFLEGIELKMEIPEAIASWMDSVACSVYDNVKPRPSTSVIDYSATRLYVRTLPNKLSWILQIPLKEKNSLKASNYITKMENIPNLDQNVVFVRLQPVMKGVPEETYKSIVPVTIRPVLANKGQLELDLQSYDNNSLQNCSVYVDDANIPYSASQNKVLLETGVHNVTIISEAYRTEVRTVRIDQAKKTVLTVEMKSIEPTLLITAPEGTVVTFDEEPCSMINKEFVITEGEHKIRFSIGDYEIIRSISAVKGKTYSANFTLDLEITEH